MTMIITIRFSVWFWEPLVHEHPSANPVLLLAFSSACGRFPREDDLKSSSLFLGFQGEISVSRLDLFRVRLLRHDWLERKRMKNLLRVLAWSALASHFFLNTVLAQQKPFPVVSEFDAPSIAGRRVNLDADGKLLPWPMPCDIGYSYPGYFNSQWTILWDQ